MTATVELKEGDVYRFSYSQAERDKAAQGWAGSLHHCFDGQVVARDGKLCDTFWGFDASEPRIVRPDQGELTFVCNLNDVRDIREYEQRWYDAVDVFNITRHHGHYKRFVVRKDATISAARMLEEVRKKRHDVEDELRRAASSAASTLFQLGELQASIESGNLTKKPWW
jgi:hypothetical protein